MKHVLITGGAGFVGYHLAKKLLSLPDFNVVSIDNLNEYYDIALKKDRLEELSGMNKFTFKVADLSNRDEIERIFETHKIDIVVNLAAQAGVRYAKKNPDVYMESNVDGFYNLISISEKYKVERFLYASSSSVYGANKNIPFSEADKVGDPMSLYAATKVANEAIASAYTYSYGLPTIGLRFFNVYGPWGRPDMAYFKWSDALVAGKTLELRDSGEMWRDMTYVEDVIEVIIRLADVETKKVPEVYNVGNQSPVKISDVLAHLSEAFTVQPVILNVPKGDEEPVKTWADTSLLQDRIQYSPDTNFKVGLDAFVEWYKLRNKR